MTVRGRFANPDFFGSNIPEPGFPIGGAAKIEFEKPTRTVTDPAFRQYGTFSIELNHIIQPGTAGRFQRAESLKVRFDRFDIAMSGPSWQNCGEFRLEFDHIRPVIVDSPFPTCGTLRFQFEPPESPIIRLGVEKFGTLRIEYESFKPAKFQPEQLKDWTSKFKSKLSKRVDYISDWKDSSTFRVKSNSLIPSMPGLAFQKCTLEIALEHPRPVSSDRLSNPCDSLVPPAMMIPPKNTFLYDDLNRCVGIADGYGGIQSSFQSFSGISSGVRTMWDQFMCTKFVYTRPDGACIYPRYGEYLRDGSGQLLGVATGLGGVMSPSMPEPQMHRPHG